MSDNTSDWAELTRRNRIRVDEWFTGGRSRAIPPANATIPHGGLGLPDDVLQPDHGRSMPRYLGPGPETAEREPGVDALFQLLERDIPDAGWVIVVDGVWSDFAYFFAQEAQVRRSGCKFWHIEPGGVQSSDLGLLEGAELRRLHADKMDDAQFRQVLVADLVIVPSEPSESRLERVQRWLAQCYYVAAEGFTGLHAADVTKGFETVQYRAPVYLVEDERLMYLA